jgi:hypothetical protein
MGGRSLSSAANEWTDVNNILAYWAQQVHFRLCELQERTGRVRPQTGGLRRTGLQPCWAHPAEPARPERAAPNRTLDRS